MAKKTGSPTIQELLNKKLEQINTILGLPLEPCSPDGNGGYVWNPGVFHLDYAYNGCTLVRMSRYGGSGTENVLHMGYISKKAMLPQLESFVRGLYVMREHMEKKAE
jgi:hypothetical protein